MKIYIVTAILILSFPTHAQFPTLAPGGWKECVENLQIQGDHLASSAGSPEDHYYNSNFEWGPVINFEDALTSGIVMYGFMRVQGVLEDYPIGACRFEVGKEIDSRSGTYQEKIATNFGPPNTDTTHQCPTASGSIINIQKQTLIESIPIDGTDLVLNYNSAYNSAIPFNRRIVIDFNTQVELAWGNYYLDVEKFTGTDYTDSFVGHEIPIVPIGSQFATTSYTWDGISDLTYSNEFITRGKFNIYVKAKVAQITGAPLPPGAAWEPTIYCYDIPAPTDDDPDAIEHTCLPQGLYIIPIYFTRASVDLYHPEVWGLNGWTLANHHYFDRNSGILFDGGTDGRIQYGSFKTVTDENYGPVDLVIDKNGAQLIYVFDQQGRHLETRHATMAYRLYKFTYDADNHITSVTDRAGKSSQFIYDSGHLSKIVSPYGVETNFTIADDTIVTATNSVGKSFEIAYDSNKLLTQFKKPNGEQTNFIYDNDGAFLREEKNTGLLQDFAQGIKELSFEGAVIPFIHKIGSDTQEIYRSIRWQDAIYLHKNNGAGERVYTKINYTGYKYEQGMLGVGYSLQQNLNFGLSFPWQGDYLSVKNQTLIGTSPLQTVTVQTDYTKNRTYTDINNPLTVQSANTAETEGASETTSLNVNAASRTITSTQPDGYSITLHYNDSGDITKLESPTDTPTEFTYNENGQLVRSQKANSFETYTYDQHGYLNGITNSNSQTTSFIRDNQGKILTKTMPNGEQTHFAYSDGGEIKKIITSSGQIHIFDMGVGDYLNSYLDAGSKTTEYIYDGDKRLREVNKPSGKSMAFNYTPETGFLNSIETDAGDYQFLSLDPVGRPGAIVSPDGIKIEFIRMIDEVQQQKWYDTDGSELATLTYTYQPDHLRISQIQINGSLIADIGYHFQRGTIDHVNDTSYQYSRVGEPYYQNIIQSNTPGLLTTYTTEGADNGNKPTQTMTATASENQDLLLGITVKRTYDGFGQASEYSTLTVDLNQAVLNSYYELKPEYDANNRLIQIQKSRKNYINEQEVSTTEFYNQYDYPLGSNNNMKEFRQILNLGGNAQKRTVATHSADDRLLTLRGSINRDYTYTDDGDILTITNCYGTTNFEYDVAGNLKKVTLPGGKVVEYKVDGLNRRVKKLVNGAVKEYYIWYDQIHLAAVLDENKNPNLTYIYGPESTITPAFVVKDGVTYKILQDPGLGSVRYIVNPATREIVQDIEYDEYGNMMKNTNVDFQPLNFAGGLYDSDTKLIRFGARDYDPTVGRWTTKDPIGFAGGDTNLYAYVGGNPMSYVDPEGTFLIPAAVGIAIFLNPTVLETAGAAFDEIYEAAGIAVAGVGARLSPLLLNNRYIRVGEGKFPEPFSKRISIGNTPGKKIEIGMSRQGRIDFKIGNNRMTLRNSKNVCPKE